MELFTGFRIMSVLFRGRIYGPPGEDWVPYINEGYHGGSYWAMPDAKREDFAKEGHITSLVAFGYEEVEKLLGINLREAMAKEPTGYEEGTSFSGMKFKIPYWDLK